MNFNFILKSDTKNLKAPELGVSTFNALKFIAMRSKDLKLSKIKLLEINLLHINLHISVSLLSMILPLYGLMSPNISHAKTQTTTKSIDLIKANSVISDEIKNTAATIDNQISPESIKSFSVNKSKAYLKLGLDYSEIDSTNSILKYGIQIHLPRFEEYWKLKFENQDEKRERGLYPLSKKNRTNNSTDDIFLGLNIHRYFKTIRLEYEPKLTFKNGFGLDHSLETSTERSYQNFLFLFSLEFFSNHDEGSGSSNALEFKYSMTNKFQIYQANNSRFTFLESNLNINHNIGAMYSSSHKMIYKTDYFRSYENNYRLTNFGNSLSFIYQLINNILEIDLTPYISHDREHSFKKNHGITITIRTDFGKI